MKFDLKTPGREDDDIEEEKKAVLSNSDFAEVAAIIKVQFVADEMKKML